MDIPVDTRAELVFNGTEAFGSYIMTKGVRRENGLTPSVAAY